MWRFLFTRAVEGVVVQHYTRQLNILTGKGMDKVRRVVGDICAEELEHHSAAPGFVVAKHPTLFCLDEGFDKISNFRF